MLEVLRAANGGGCKAILLYLADSSVEREGLGPVVSAIGDQVFRAFLTQLSQEGRTPAREALLLDHALYYLSYCCHRFSRLRGSAFSFIVQVCVYR